MKVGRHIVLKIHEGLARIARERPEGFLEASSPETFKAWDDLEEAAMRWTAWRVPESFVKLTFDRYERALERAYEAQQSSPGRPRKERTG